MWIASRKLKGNNKYQDTCINIVLVAIEAPSRTIVSNAGGESKN